MLYAFKKYWLAVVHNRGYYICSMLDVFTLIAQQNIYIYLDIYIEREREFFLGKVEQILLVHYFRHQCG